MSAGGDDHRVTQPGTARDLESLLREIERYLRLLDALRATARPPDEERPPPVTRPA